MGMVELTVKLMMRQSLNHNFSDCHLLTIGRQGVTFSIVELRKWADELDYKLDETHFTKALAENRSLDDIELFKSLGFKMVDSMDCSEYEYASIVCNLNNDIPSSLHENFDVIYDGGSTEHMFNIAKAFENYSKMLKTGGLMIHSLPSTGCVDHGFFMFSPTLFYDYYTQNKWDIVTFYLINLPLNSFKTWKLYEYPAPGPSLEDVSFVGRWCIYFVARKNLTSGCNYNIGQHFFKNLWHTEVVGDTAVTAGHDSGLGKRTLNQKICAKIRKKYRKIMQKLSTQKGSKKIPFKQIEL